MGFIRLAYMIRCWRPPPWPSADKRVREFSSSSGQEVESFKTRGPKYPIPVRDCRSGGSLESCWGKSPLKGWRIWSLLSCWMTATIKPMHLLKRSEAYADACLLPHPFYVLPLNVAEHIRGRSSPFSLSTHIPQISGNTFNETPTSVFSQYSRISLASQGDNKD
jgi:hypothetical protein